MEQRFADLTRKIREAVIKKAQEQASEREEASNGCVRILLVAHCEEASSWMFLPSGRDRYEETTPIVPGSDMILQEDESLEIDHSVVAAMKIAHCMKARRLKKGSISGLELSDGNNTDNIEAVCGYSPLRGAICIRVMHGIEECYCGAFLDVYVGVSNADEYEDQECAAVAIPIVEKFFNNERDRGNWPFFVREPDLCPAEAQVST